MKKRFQWQEDHLENHQVPAEDSQADQRLHQGVHPRHLMLQLTHLHQLSLAVDSWEVCTNLQSIDLSLQILPAILSAVWPRVSVSAWLTERLTPLWDLAKSRWCTELRSQQRLRLQPRWRSNPHPTCVRFSKSS